MKNPDFSNIKLIVSDMDGTLLNSDHEVSPDFFDLVRILKTRGIRFAVASGRQYYSLVERMEPVKEDLIFIAENGAIVVEQGEEKLLVPMEGDFVHRIIREVKGLKGEKHLVLCGRKQAYIENTDPEFMEPFLNHYEKYEVVDDLLEVKDDVFLKVTICDLSGAEENSLPFVSHFKKEAQVKLAGKIWVDFTAKSAQKGNAVKRVQELYNIKKEETMSFGDYLNDVELFAQSGISYAVANAHEEVKAAAAFHTASNDDDGVEIILRELLKSEKVR